MSRCFPYPPPGYAGKKCVVSNEASLMMSTKLQRENVELKPDKKGKKRKVERKEKREERKKAKLSAEGEKKLIEGKSAKDGPEDKSNHELMLLEKSNLTEEHGRPCNSSDSTQTSSEKRKQDEGPSMIAKNYGDPSMIAKNYGEPSMITKNYGKILKIRLPSRKREDPATISKDGRLCSPSADPATSPTLVLHAQKPDKLLHSSAGGSTTVAHQTFQSNKMLPPVPPVPGQPPSTAKSHDIKRRKIEANHGGPFLSDNVCPPSAKRIRTPTYGLGMLSSDEKATQKLEALPYLTQRTKIATPSHTPLASTSHDKNMQKAEPLLPLPKLVEIATPVHAPLSTVAFDGKMQKVEALLPLPEKTLIATPSHVPPRSTSHDKKTQRKAAKYRDLMENWAPPPLWSVLDEVDDQDWLFAGRKGKENNSVKRLVVEGNCGPSCGSSAAQPRAVFLEDVGIYALPYTVPF